MIAMLEAGAGAAVFSEQRGKAATASNAFLAGAS